MTLCHTPLKALTEFYPDAIISLLTSPTLTPCEGRNLLLGSHLYPQSLTQGLPRLIEDTVSILLNESVNGGD